jgi:hypothetical protein
MCIDNLQPFTGEVPEFGWKVLLENESKELWSPIFHSQEGGYSKTKWNKDPEPLGFCFFFNRKDARTYANALYERQSIKKRVFKVKVKGVKKQGIHSFGNNPSCKAFTASYFKLADAQEGSK